MNRWAIRDKNTGDYIIWNYGGRLTAKEPKKLYRLAGHAKSALSQFPHNQELELVKFEFKEVVDDG